MKKLVISIVTYNRAKHIREDLAAIAQPTKECDIDIYIYDGSSNRQTEYVVEEFLRRGYDHIYYFRTDKQVLASDSIYQRIERALTEPHADYIWLCGDKFVIGPEHYVKILSYVDKSYDIITIYGGTVLKGTREFNKASRFLNYVIVPITHLGSTVIKKELIESYNIREECSKLSAFGTQLIYLRAIETIKEFRGVVIDGERQVSIGTRYKTKSGTYSQMWPTWVKGWCKFIDAVPSAYDDVRKNLYNRPDLQLGFFSLKELLRQRSEGQFDCKKYWEYKEYVKKVIVMPHVFVFCISLLPKNSAKWLWSNYDCGKRVYSWAKSGVKLIGEKL